MHVTGLRLGARRQTVRFSPTLVLCGIICSLGSAGAAEAPKDKGSALSQNPILSQVAQLDPDVVKSLLSRLAVLRANAPREGEARGEALTAGEAKQISANPAFAAAYDRNPTETLGLLRQVNAFLTTRH